MGLDRLEPEGYGPPAPAPAPAEHAEHNEDAAHNHRPATRHEISPHAHTPKRGAGPFDAHPQTIGNHCPKVFGQWIKL